MYFVVWVWCAGIFSKFMVAFVLVWGVSSTNMSSNTRCLLSKLIGAFFANSG